jgi:hypothetical protein
MVRAVEDIRAVGADEEASECLEFRRGRAFAKN